MIRTSFVIAIASLCATMGVAGQEASPDSSRQGQPLRVFLDCWRCDLDHFRREVGFVSYVRDRMDADLHVLVTSRETGAGGNEYSFHFIGLRALEGREDTLLFASRPDDTDAETRDDLVRTFKLGLVPWVASSNVGRGLDVIYREPVGESASEAVDDPWDLWVFRLRVGGELEGESRERSWSLDGSVSASRTSEDLKVDFSARGDWSEDSFEFSDGEESTFSSRSYDLEGTVVWSLSPHWSTGVSASATGSTHQNQDLAFRLGPALEYNIFPYRESTQRQITFLYRIQVAAFDYEEVTLFNETAETRLAHSLQIASAFNRPWGEVDFSLTGSNYLDDASQHRVELFSRVEVRLIRGLSLDVRGSAARVKDQIYEPREDIPDEDILLRRRELGTDYRFSVDVGFNFLFGSVFNNVVNPRMSTGGRERDWH